MNIRDQLRRPFPVGKVLSRPGGGGMMLNYITARDVMHRLDEVFGVEGWQVSYYESNKGVTMCRLSCNFDGEWITKEDGAGETSIEGEKGGISDALKRAGVLFGIGRYLYEPGLNKGAFPKWATPEGFDEIILKALTRSLPLKNPRRPDAN